MNMKHATAWIFLGIFLFCQAMSLAADDVYKGKRFATFLDNGSSLEVIAVGRNPYIQILLHNFGKRAKFVKIAPECVFSFSKGESLGAHFLSDHSFRNSPPKAEEPLYVLIEGGEMPILGSSANTIRIYLPERMVRTFKSLQSEGARSAMKVKMLAKLEIESINRGEEAFERDEIVVPIEIIFPAQ